MGSPLPVGQQYRLCEEHRGRGQKFMEVNPPFPLPPPPSPLPPPTSPLPPSPFLLPRRRRNWRWVSWHIKIPAAAC